MTEKEYEKFFVMGSNTFHNLQNPTAEQCLAFLRGYRSQLSLKKVDEHIPKKHREFCKAQLRLEGLS